MRYLDAYDWPGNVRELECVVTRAVTLTERSVIQSHDLALPEKGFKPYQERKEEMIRDWEKKQIVALLVSQDGNVCHAAEVAGMDPRVMRERIRKLGIDPNDFRSKGDNDPEETNE
jgi:DNA-binding NtrC family response regulator